MSSMIIREILLDDCDDCKKATPCHPTVERNRIKIASKVLDLIALLKISAWN